MTFHEALTEQRWDDHRLYHHNRINQSLHLVSALSFICAYGLVVVEPAAAVFIAWLIAMPTRQLGHFVFEPRDYDRAARATHEEKEQMKVGYNLRRKVVLLSIWGLSPLVLLADPALLGMFTPATDIKSLLDNVSILWLVLGFGAVAFRTVHLFFLRDVQTGLVWCTKILTDPFHDVKLYHQAPLYVLRGELFDPIVSDGTAA